MNRVEHKTKQILYILFLEKCLARDREKKPSYNSEIT